MSINRRQFLRRAAGAVSTAAVIGAATSQPSAAQNKACPHRKHRVSSTLSL